MQRNNQSNNKSGQLARKSQKSNKMKNPQSGLGTLGTPSLGAPVAYSSPSETKAPKIKSGLKCTRIIHRELVSNLTASTTFSANSVVLNPGLSASFPWLSGVAANYEQYAFRKLRFHFITRSATSFAGSVLLAPEYDVLDSVPTTEIAVAMMDGAKEDVPWRDQILDFSVQSMHALGPRKFIRTTSPPTGSDQKTYDVGVFLACAASCADGTTVMGKIWVDYDIDLFIPQNPSTSASGNIGNMSLFRLTTANQALTSGVAATIVFNGSVINTLNAVNTSGSFVLPAGGYHILAIVDVSNATTTGNDSTATLTILQDGVAKVIASAVQNTDVGGGVVDRSDYNLSQQWFYTSTGVEAITVTATFTSTAGAPIVNADQTTLSFVRTV